ncbi:unnamed protein product, partial [Effrenium voratum]
LEPSADSNSPVPSFAHLPCSAAAARLESRSPGVCETSGRMKTSSYTKLVRLAGERRFDPGNDFGMAFLSVLRTRLGHRTDWPTPRRQLRGSQRRRRLGGFGDFGGAAAAGAGSGAEAASGARHLQGPRQRAVRAEREGGALGPHHRAVLQAGRGSAHGPETGDAGAAQEASGDLQAAPRKVNRSAQRSPAPCELSDVPC